MAEFLGLSGELCDLCEGQEGDERGSSPGLGGGSMVVEIGEILELGCCEAVAHWVKVEVSGGEYG